LLQTYQFLFGFVDNCLKVKEMAFRISNLPIFVAKSYFER